MRKSIALGGLLVFFLFLMLTVVNLHSFGIPSNTAMDDYFIHNGQVQTGANNIVTSIVFDYRGYDTLGEATVLFTAVSGVLLALRKEGGDEK